MNETLISPPTLMSTARYDPGSDQAIVMLQCKSKNFNIKTVKISNQYQHHHATIDLYGSRKRRTMCTTSFHNNLLPISCLTRTQILYNTHYLHITAKIKVPAQSSSKSIKIHPIQSTMYLVRNRRWSSDLARQRAKYKGRDVHLIDWYLEQQNAY